MSHPAGAFAPGNISCVFKIHTDPNPRWAGSLGFGFTINEGVTVSVDQAPQTLISFNKSLIPFPTVATVINTLSDQPTAVHIASPLPLGAGFGLSGASSLATAYALNEYLQLKQPQKELAVIAHTADALNKTGLGDVVNQYYGGALIKFEPSSHFVVEKLPIVNCQVYCKYISKLSTQSVLTNPTMITKINQAADRALNDLQNMLKQNHQVTLKYMLTLAKAFALQSDLLQDAQTKKIIAAIEQQGGHASMIMLGNAVVSDIPFEGATAYTISDNSAHLL